MRHLVLLFAVWLCGSMSPAWGYGTVGKKNQVTVTCQGSKLTGGVVTGSGTSYQSACGGLVDALRSAYTDPYYGENKNWVSGSPSCTALRAPDGSLNTSGQCSGTFSCGGAGFCYVVAGGSAEEAFSCPPFASPNASGGCTCNVGYRPGADGSCVPYTCPAGGMGGPSGGGPYPSLARAWAGTTYCISGAGGGAHGGCEYEMRPDYVGNSGGGGYYASGTGGLNGRYCDSPPPPSVPNPPEDGGDVPEPPPPPCPARQCPGTVNGASVCAPCSEEHAEGPSKGASAPDGGGSAPGLGDPAAPPGATSSNTTTSCTVAGSCTTTTNYYGAGGVLLGSTSKTDSKGGFCAENPGSTICKNSAISGSCGAVTCSGDAIQCAIAREQAKRNCELWDSAPGNHPGVVAANGLARPDGHPGLVPDSMDMGAVIDTSNALGGGSCPADFSFSVAGQSLSIPFSTLCPHLATLGLIVQAFAMLAAAFIVFRS